MKCNFEVFTELPLKTKSPLRCYDVSVGKHLGLPAVRRLKQFTLFGLTAREYEGTTKLRNIDNYLAVDTA
jgi:hypothetical protein